MKEKPTGKPPAKTGTNWSKLRTISDQQIRKAIVADPDARATDADFWRKASVVIPRSKQAVTIRLDADLLEWLRKEKGYQTRINAVLRTYMAHRTGRKRA